MFKQGHFFSLSSDPANWETSENETLFFHRFLLKTETLSWELKMMMNKVPYSNLQVGTQRINTGRGQPVSSKKHFRAKPVLEESVIRDIWLRKCLSCAGCLRPVFTGLMLHFISPTIYILARPSHPIHFPPKQPLRPLGLLRQPGARLQDVPLQMSLDFAVSRCCLG